MIDWFRRLLSRRSDVGADLTEEVDAELGFHLDMRARDNRRAGMDREVARRAAEERFGRRADIRREGLRVRRSARRQRAWRNLLDSTAHDLSQALRGMRRAPGFTLTVVVTLALGIGANAAIFSVVDATLLRALPYPGSDRLVLIVGPTASRELRDAWVELDSIEEAGMLSVWTSHLTGVGEPRHVSGMPVGDGFFQALGVRAARGRTLVADDHPPHPPPGFVVTHRLWMSLFGGDPEAIGRSYRLEGRSYTLVGVMPEGFDFARYPERGLFAPASHLAPRVPGGMLLARIAPGVRLERVRAAATSFAAVAEVEPPEGMPERARAGFSERARQVRVDSLRESVVGETAPSLWSMAGAVGLLLLLACSNVANLMISRASSRGQAIAVRRFLGASRARLARQLLTESLVLALLGGALGLAVAVWAVPALAAMSPGYLRRAQEVALDLRVVGFTGGAAVVTGLLFGLAPLTALRDRGRGAAVRGQHGDPGRGSHLLVRRGLIVLEVALALVLLVGAGLLSRSFLRLVPDSPGFDPRGKLTFRVELPRHAYADDAARRADVYRRLVVGLERLPEIGPVAAVNHLPIQGVAAYVEARVDDPEGEQPRGGGVFYYLVSPGFLEVMGIPMVRGRGFVEADADRPVAVVNEAAARRFWPEGDPLGSRLRVETYGREMPAFTVVGVAADTRTFWFSLDPRPSVWVPWPQDPPPGGMDFVLRTGAGPQRVAPSVRRTLRDVDRELPFPGVVRLETFLWDTVDLPRFYMTLMTVFSGIGLVLAAVGFLGVLSYWVQCRSREIGVRLALGARPAQVVRLVLGQGALLVGLGTILGIAGALGLARFLESLLWGLDPLDPVTFVATPALLVAVALVACWWPARRAARVDPLEVLRAE